MTPHLFRTLRGGVSRITSWMGRGRRERELAAEIESHLQLDVDDRVRAGMSEQDARRAALLALGGIEPLREAYRDRLRLPWLDSLMRDARFALRSLARTPGFTAAAIGVLALGVGANTAIFSVINATLLRPLPIRDDGRVAVMWITDPAHGRSRVGPSGVDYVDWLRQQTSFDDLFLFEHGSGTMTGGVEPEQVTGLRVTTNFADFIGVTPVVGRAFRTGDGSRNVMLLSSAYWRSHLNADPSVVGRVLTLNGDAYEVIGVLPTEACFWYPADVVVPWPIDRLRQADSNLGVFGRLRAGTTFARAQAEMDAVALREADARPNDRRGWGISVVPIRSVVTQYIRPALLVLAGAVGLVLLIACANVANLLVARTIARRREIAVRSALGASRWRLAQQFLVESALLGLVGGLAGLLTATWANDALRRILPAAIPVPAAASQVPLPHGEVDATVLLFALAIALLTSVLSGLAPALFCLRETPVGGLKEGGRTIDSGAGRARGALVTFEAMLAIVLVVGAVLTIRSFWNLFAVQPGFDPDRLLTVQIKFADEGPRSKYHEPGARALAVSRFLENLRAVPAVQSAALAMILPLSQDDQDVGGFLITERPRGSAAERATAEFRIVTPGYFETMKIPVITGRAFADSDSAAAQRVVLIDQTLAHEYFGSDNPVGRHIQVSDASRPSREIIGIAGPVLDDGLDRQARPTIYLPYAQVPAQTMSVIVRTHGDAGTVLPALKQAIWKIDPNQPLFNARRMDDILSSTVSAQRLAFVLLGLFAGLALVLAAVGIYSVTAFGVRQRTREIGIRMALGAGPGSVLAMVIGRGIRQALAGLIGGLVAAALMSQLLASLLYQIRPLDPLTFAAVAAGFMAVALVANGIPAWRAARTGPLEALSDR